MTFRAPYMNPLSERIPSTQHVDSSEADSLLVNGIQLNLHCGVLNAHGRLLSAKEAEGDLSFLSA